MLASEPGAREPAAPLALVSADCATTASPARHPGASSPAPQVAASRQALRALPQQGYAARTAGGCSPRVRLPRPQPGGPGDATGILTRWPPLPPPHLRRTSPRASPRKIGAGAPLEQRPPQLRSNARAHVQARQPAFGRDGRAPERASPPQGRGGAAGAAPASPRPAGAGGPARRHLQARSAVAAGALSREDRHKSSAAPPSLPPSPLGTKSPPGPLVPNTHPEAVQPHPDPECAAAAPGQPLAASAAAGALPAANGARAASQARRRRWAWLRTLLCLGRGGDQPGGAAAPVDAGRQLPQAGASSPQGAAPPQAAPGAAASARAAATAAQAAAGAPRTVGDDAFEEGCGARSAGCSCAAACATLATPSAPDACPAGSGGLRGVGQGARAATAPVRLSSSPQDALSQRLIVGPRSDEAPSPAVHGAAPTGPGISAVSSGIARHAAPSSQDAHEHHPLDGRAGFYPAPKPATASGFSGGIGLSNGGVRHTAVTLVELLVRAVRSPSRGAAGLAACQARSGPAMQACCQHADRPPTSSLRAVLVPVTCSASTLSAHLLVLVLVLGASHKLPVTTSQVDDVLACGSPHRTLSLTAHCLLPQADPTMERTRLLPHVPLSCAAAGAASSPATPAAHSPASRSPLGSWPAPARDGSSAAPGSGLRSLKPSPGYGAGSAAGARPPWRPGGGRLPREQRPCPGPAAGGSQRDALSARAEASQACTASLCRWPDACEAC